LPREIDLKKVMKNIPDTTDSVFSSNRYKDYTMDELIEISSQQ
jgi:cellulase/cellobiase CelA1